MNAHLLAPTLLPLALFFATGGALGQTPEPPSPGATAEPSVPDAWRARVAQGILREEYRFAHLGEETFSAPNRAEDLRCRVSSAGLEVFPRETDASGEGADWKLALGTSSFGRTGDPPLGAGALACRALAVEGARAELDRGSLVEWFENSERGIEQGWTIADRLPGIDALEIGLEIAGLGLRLDEGGRSGTFVGARGEVRLGYRGLRAWDATGRELDARLVPTPAGVVVRVDDTGAVYPLTVDPLLTSASWDAQGDQAGAQLGYSVATAGDVNADGFTDVIVGAYLYDGGETDEGRAWVYHGSAAGLSATPAWSFEVNQDDAWLGASVATAGDVNGDGFSDVIVGARQYSGGESREGAAFVFHGSPGGLSSTPDWSAESDQADAYFGLRVATAGDVNGDGFADVIVGSPNYDNGETDEGQVWVYHGSIGGLSGTADWIGGSNQVGALHGFAVSTAGDVNGDGYSDVIVGTYLYDGGHTDEGRVWVYHGSNTGLPNSPDWIGESGQTGAQHGFSVATAGDVNGDGYSDVLVGTRLYDNGQADEGRVWLYEGSAGGLSGSPGWTGESNQAGAEYGYSISTAGDVNGDGFSDVLVGARHFDDDHTNEGRAWLYQGSAGGLSATAGWAGESAQAGALYGFWVSTAGDVNGDGYSDVLVGAPFFDDGQTDEGRAWLYRGSASGVSDSPAWIGGTSQAFARHGWSVSTAGDVNGDGFCDVIVGTPLYDIFWTNQGRAWVYHGSAAGLSTTPNWTSDGPEGGQNGWSVSTAGDVNGDGFSDVIVGAPFASPETGSASIHYGSADGLTGHSVLALFPLQDSAYGHSVASAGDVNGDGFSDVIVGAPFFVDDMGLEVGGAFLYLGSAGGIKSLALPDWIGEPGLPGAQYGYSVSSAGDVNADGFSDVIVGSPTFANGALDEGRAFVYHGSADGLSTSASWTGESNQDSAEYGRSVATAGDVNGDGFSDVIVGSPLFDGGNADEGRAWLYRGSAFGLWPVPVWIGESGQAFAEYGTSVSTAGDVNGDGYSDVIVGAYRFDNGQTDEGRAWLYHGSASGLPQTPDWIGESGQAYAQYGFSVSAAGDVNGDGFSDVLVGAPQFDAAEFEVGRVWLYLGNVGDGGLVRGLQQRDRDDTRPIAVLGKTGLDGLFRIHAEFPGNPARVGWVASQSAWLEWEVKPLGVAFDGTEVEAGAPQPMPTSGGTLTFDELVALGGPGPGGPFVLDSASMQGVFHWRARIATNNPLFANTGWFSVQGDNVTETKLRIFTELRDHR